MKSQKNFKNQQIANDFFASLQNPSFIENIQINPKDLLSKAYHFIMLAERNLHNQKHNDQSNGYYKRDIGTPYGKIDLDVPRSRSSNNKFRPLILPDSYQRNQKQVNEILMALLASNYSPNQIKAYLQELGIPYSIDDLKKIADNLISDFNTWNERPLNNAYQAIFIDAYNAETLINNKVQNLVIFTVIGIDFDAKKDIIATFFMQGNENKEFWLQVFNKLIARGLQKPLYIVTDDFAGLKDAVNTLFPLSLHQLCIVHLKRNILKNMAKNDATKLNQTILSIQNQDLNFEQSINLFLSKINEFKPKYPTFIEYLNTRINNYFAFTKLPKPVRKYFYTSNCVESFNSILEKMRRKSGNFFQNENTLKLNIYINYKKINENWINGLPLLKGYCYELSQLFASIFKHQPNNFTQLL